MNLSELYEMIQLPSEIIEKLNELKYTFSFKEYEIYIERLRDISDAPSAYYELKELLGNDPGSMKMMLIQLECVRRNYDFFINKGIGEQIFIDTYRCFSRFANECKVRNGSYYFDRGWWTFRQTSMSLFRIGQLEFELITDHSDGEVDKNEWIGTSKRVAIHICSDSIFTSEAIDQSINMAKNIIGRIYPDYATVPYTCNSWLLSPALKELLDPVSSNIISYQNRFEIIHIDLDAPDYREWVFKCTMDANPIDFSEETTLQKNMKKYVLDGNKVGLAYGKLK